MTASGGLMDGKCGLVMGVANDRSIAWGIAKTLADNGAKLAFTYQGEPLERRVRPLAEQAGADLILPCDVTDTKSLDETFAAIEKTWGKLDFLVHAIAFSDREQLKGKYVATTKDNFVQTMLISCYSFTELCRRAAPLMSEGGSAITLTYFGAERVMPHYNVMGVAKAALEASVRYLAMDLGGDGIRVNAISAGPIRTLAASGVKGIRDMLAQVESSSPLRRNVDTDEVGNAAAFLCSDLASGITGQVLYVDAGYSIIGMPAAASD